MIRIRFVIIILAISLAQIAYAQEELDSLLTPFQAEINLVGKSYGDSIVLRWAPTTPGAWFYLNKTGYTIEKTSFQDEGDFDPATYQKITELPIKPLPLEAWEPIVKNGPDKELSAIAAQALYGKSFSAGGATLYDAADEFMNRYSFSILSADFSAVTATALGLRISDRDVRENRHYIYRIYASVPGQNYKIDTTYFVVQNLRDVSVPTPLIGEVYEGELNINISWERALHEPAFSAYIIERSEEGRAFSPLNSAPFIHAESDHIDSRSTVFQYIDSIPENYKPYHYRLIGITPFGEKSPPSEIVLAMGRDRTPPPAPVNVEARQIDSGRVEITWVTPEKVGDLEGFYIGRGDDLKTNFQPLHDQIIPKDSTSYIDNQSDQLGGNYYVVAAVDTAGNGSISMVSYAAILDSIPPLPPISLKGEIDSSGVVTLKWRLGDEIDLAGYMIYFSNSPDHVFSTVNQAPLGDTVYTDTIQVKTLTKKIYYRLKAVDTRWNYSGFSEILELSRPDFIPPTSPVFCNYKLSKEGMKLEWIPSSSNDVAGYELQILENGELKKRVYIEKQGALKKYHYLHKELNAGLQYTYIIATLDDSGLKSNPAPPITINAIDLQPKEAIQDLTLNMNKDGSSLSLKWTFHEPDQLKRYILFRAVAGASFVSYKSLPAKDTSFEDHMIRKGVQYEYCIKAVFNNGRQTPFSNIVSTLREME